MSAAPGKPAASGAPAMQPLRFGEPGRQLFGLLQLPAPSAARDRAVLVCNPFGQEAIRCRRLLRVLGDRLARHGFAVLRFDYFGTGDSDGDDSEGDLLAWQEDVLKADEELARLAGCSTRSWFGLRAGGTIAALASARAPRPPESLVLWEPVVDGGAYLAELRRAHESALRQGAAGLATTYRMTRPGSQVSIPEDEVLGFPLGPGLREQFAALGAVPFPGAKSRCVHLISADPAQAGAARAAWEGAACVRERVIATRIAWATDEAMNSAIVPAEPLQAILECLLEAP